MNFSWYIRISICLSSSSGWMMRMMPNDSRTVVKFSVLTTADSTSLHGTLLIESVIWPFTSGDTMMFAPETRATEEHEDRRSHVLHRELGLRGEGVERALGALLLDAELVDPVVFGDVL